MALTYKNPRYHKYDRGGSEGALKPTYEGRVLAEKTTYSVRVMSDVWADLYHAVIWDDETDAPITVGLGNSEFGCDVTAEVDADEETLAKYEVWKEAERIRKEAEAEAHRVAEEKRLAEEAEETAKRNALAVRKGVKVRVVKGRKVAKGTEGVCFWEGHGQYGPRIGLKEEDGTVHWTATSNCVALLDDVPHGTTPDGGWRAYMEARYQAEEAAAALLPKKGEWVCLTADETKFGRIFWVKGERLGFKMNPRNRDEEPTWANAGEVTVLTGDPRKGGRTARNGGERIAPAAAPEAKTNPMADMPYPYCAIAKLEVVDGMWKAFDAEGGFLLDLTPDAAIKLMEKMAA